MKIYNEMWFCNQNQNWKYFHLVLLLIRGKLNGLDYIWLIK